MNSFIFRYRPLSVLVLLLIASLQFLCSQNLTTNSYTSGNGTWELAGPSILPTNGTGQLNGMGRMSCVAFDPIDSSKMYAGSPTGGFFVSDDAGVSWEASSDGLTRLGVSSIVVHPTNTSIIYIGTGDRDAGDTQGYGVWRSADSGVTWSSLNIGMGNRTVNEIIMDPTDPDIMLAACDNNRIYRTTDGGLSWTPSASLGTNPKDMAYHPTNSQIVYASGTQFHKSTDGGITWTQITSVLPASPQRMAIAVSIDEPNWVYILAGDSNGLIGIYQSTDSGINFFTRRTTPNILGYSLDGSSSGGTPSNQLSISADPTDANIIYTAGINVWKSTDGGTSMNSVSYWVGPSAGRDGLFSGTNFMVFSPFDNDLYVTNNGGIGETSDAGITWDEYYNGLSVSMVYKIGVSNQTEGKVIMGQEWTGTVLMEDGEFTTEIGGSGVECAIDPTDDNYVYGSLPNGDIRRSTNGGLTFSSIGFVIPEQGAYVTPFKIDPNNSNTMFAGYDNVWLNDDVKNTTTWTQISNFANTANIRDLAIAPSNSNVVYISKNDNSFRKSSNALSSNPTWTDLSANLPVNNEPVDIEIDPLDENHLFIALNNNIYESLNGGSSWTDISGTLPNINLNTIVLDYESSQGALYVGMDVGIYYKDDTMADWSLYADGLPNVEITELEIQYASSTCSSKLYAGTYGRGLWRSDLKDPGNVAPIACFDVSTTSTCLGNTATLNDQSDFAPTSWSWSFSPNTVNYVNGTSSSSQNPEVEFLSTGNYTITLTATNANGSNTEIKTNFINVSNSFSATSFNEDFESESLCATTSNCGATTCTLSGNWTNLTNGNEDDIDWRVDQDGTPSTATGPPIDASEGTSTGNYIYLEASSCSGRTAILESTCINVDLAYDFKFSYHMFGNAVGELHLDLQSNGVWITDVLPAVSGDQGIDWIEGTLDLSSYVGQSIKFRFRGITGNGFQSDIALDDFKFEPKVTCPIITDITDQTVTQNFTLPIITGTNLSGDQSYFTGTGGTGMEFQEGDTICISDFSSYPVTLYAYDDNGSCSDEDSFSLTINSPTAQTSFIYDNGSWTPRSPDDTSNPSTSMDAINILNGSPSLDTVEALDITVASGATLQGNAGATLNIYGNLNVQGTLDYTQATVKKMSCGDSSWTFGSSAVGTFTAGSDSDKITIDGNLDIYTLLTSDNPSGTTIEIPEATGMITLKCSASGTAVVDYSKINLPIDPSDYSNTSKIRIERWFSGVRKFRLVSSAVSTSNFSAQLSGATTIRDNWQGNGVSPGDAGYQVGVGTHITGAGGAANGFDTTSNNNPSLFGFDNLNNTWTTVTETDNPANYIKAGDPYRLFVRGDRGIDLTDDNSSGRPTVIRTTGELYQQDRVFAINSNAFNLIGNPYQSVYDILGQAANAGDAINIAGINAQQMWIVDPTVTPQGGNYVTYDAVLGVATLGSFNGYMQPGQAIFFEGSGNGSTQITLQKSYATTSITPLTTVYSNSGPFIMHLKLRDANAADLDGTIIGFDSSFNNAIDADDSIKFLSNSFNLARVDGGNYFSIERRNIPQGGNALPLYITVNGTGTFTLNAAPINLGNINSYIVDSLTGARTMIANNAPTNYTFQVSSGDAIDVSSRFRIEFEDGTLGVEDSAFAKVIKIYPNPSDGDDLFINFDGINGQKRISIFNLLGQSIIRFETEENGIYELGNIGLITGTYLVQISTESSQTVQKLIIE